MASPFSGRAGRLAGMWAAEQAQNDYNTGMNFIDQGQRTSLDALNAGYARARPEYEGAINRYQPWVTAGTGALGRYQDTLGQNGQAGYDRAVSNFRAGPGYQYQVDQASDAVARKASAMGALGSGNTMAAIADRARNMADAEFGKYQDRLNNLSAQGLAASGAQAGIQTGLGNLEAQLGRDESTLSQAGTAQRLASLGQKSGTTISAGTGALLAGQQAAQNRLNFGMGLGGIGASLLGNVFSQAASGLTGLSGAGGGIPSSAANFVGTGSPYAYGAGGYTGMGPFLL